MTSILQSILLLLAATLGSTTSPSPTLRVHFSLGSAVLRDSAALKSFAATLDTLDAGGAVEYVTITAGVSPEGGAEVNARLARERCRAIRDYLLCRTSLPAWSMRAVPTGPDWEGLDSLVAASAPSLESAGDILSVIRSGGTTQHRLEALRALHGGEAWQVLQDGFFPQQRSGTVRVTLRPPRGDDATTTAQEPSRDTVVLVHRDTIIALAGTQAPSGEQHRSRATRQRSTSPFPGEDHFRTPVAALRSNLLLPLMNIGVELPLGNRWSLEADWYSPWCPRRWMNSLGEDYRNCFQVQGAYLCGRVWLGRRHSGEAGDERYRLRGHSVGMGLGAVHYDVGADYRGRQGDALALGADYKYALPLGRGRVHVEFTIGVCAYWERCRDYAVETYTTADQAAAKTYSNGRLLGTSQRRDLIGIAPFKAAVSVVVPLFRKDRSGARTAKKEASL